MGFPLPGAAGRLALSLDHMRTHLDQRITISKLSDPGRATSVKPQT